jgi:hypothetical protein
VLCGGTRQIRRAVGRASVPKSVYKLDMWHWYGHVAWMAGAASEIFSHGRSEAIPFIFFSSGRALQNFFVVVIISLI